MAENVPPPSSTGVSGNGDIAGIPFYEKSRAHLKDLLRKKRALETALANKEDEIYKKETEYLEETPAGNIITGFEGYTKGGTAGAGARRGGNSRAIDANRVFSRSSVSFGANMDTPVDTALSTPVAATAPTPLSANFMRADGASNHATPTSATSANKTGAGLKKNKKAGGDDSENESRDPKKARTNFGVSRK